MPAHHLWQKQRMHLLPGPAPCVRASRLEEIFNRSCLLLPCSAAVWIPLKVLQSVAAWLVWRGAPTDNDLWLPLGLFTVHLFLGNWWNVSWGICRFGKAGNEFWSR
jgi:hypothetical protein